VADRLRGVHSRDAAATEMKPPFAYEPLGCAIRCFCGIGAFLRCLQGVESGRRRRLGPRAAMSAIRSGDYKISSGHACGRLCVRGSAVRLRYQFWFLDDRRAVEKRADLTEVGPKVFAHYPQFKPVFARYREDFPQHPPPKPAGISFLPRQAGCEGRDASCERIGPLSPV